MKTSSIYGGVSESREITHCIRFLMEALLLCGMWRTHITSSLA